MKLIPILLLLTFYCPCKKCCKQYSPEVGRKGITTSGVYPAPNYTIACDRSWMGKKFIIPGRGLVVCEDTGGSKITGKHIDVFVPTHEEALNQKVQWVRSFEVKFD